AARTARGRRARGGREAHGAAPPARLAWRARRLVGTLEASVHVRRLARRAPGGTRAGEPHGRGDARQVPDRRPGRPGAARAGPALPRRIARARTLPVRGGPG